MRRGVTKGLRFTIDLSKISGRTMEAPIGGEIQEPTVIDWGDGTSETITDGTFPEHTYADGAGDVFTITIRSATGHLPFCYWAKEASDIDTPSGPFTFGTISIDHFAGLLGRQTARSYGSGIRNTRNLKYCDPRITGLSRWTSFASTFRTSGIEQNIGSFCFDFCESVSTISGMFYGCKITGTIPPGLFDNCQAVTSVKNAFNGCSYLPPPPYLFWEKDFPVLAETTDCYAGCSSAMLAQVPTDYGGTMTT